MSSTTRVFFATDIHASTRCFKKFLNSGEHYNAQVLIIGGDVTGKALVPVKMTASGRAVAFDNGAEVDLNGEREIVRFENRVADAGSYAYRCEPEEYERISAEDGLREQLFERLIEMRMREWVELADERMAGKGRLVFFSAGNDDIYSIDAIIDAGEVMKRPEGKCVELDDHCTMISTGLANETPFHCPRDVPEVELTRVIDEMAARVPDLSRCVFNLHCPPYKSKLDNAPKLDADLRPRMNAFGIERGPVGSTAVRDAIERYQPLLGLHGHIHESKGSARIGKTLCLNPGSEYHEGTLRGVLVEIAAGKLKNHTFTTG